jgi:hypothetical protein
MNCVAHLLLNMICSQNWMSGTIWQWQQLEWLPFLDTLLVTSWGDLGWTATHYATVVDLQHERVNFQSCVFCLCTIWVCDPWTGEWYENTAHSARHGWYTNCVLPYESNVVFKHTHQTWMLTCHCTATQPAYHRALAGLRSDADVPTSWFQGQVCKAGCCCQPMFPVHSAQDILQSSA